MQNKLGRRSLGLLLVAALVASLPVPSGAGVLAAVQRATFKLSKTFDGQKWGITVQATDFGGSAEDNLTITFKRRHLKKDARGRVVHSLAETHTFVVDQLNEDTVAMENDLSGTIDIDNQKPGVLTGEVNFDKVTGSPIKESCGGKTRTRQLTKVGAGTLVLVTDNELFGEVDLVLGKGMGYSTDGTCDVSPQNACPPEGLELDSFQFDNDRQFSWKVFRRKVGRYADVNVNIFEEFGTSDILSIDLIGKALKKDVMVEDNLKGGMWKAESLPTLEGNAYFASDSAGGVVGSPCGDGFGTQVEQRDGVLGGTLRFRPAGTSPAAIGQTWSDTSINARKTRVLEL